MKSRKFYPWLVVALLWVVALLNYMDRQMLSTMQAAMKVDIVELQQAEAFGALMAVFLWIYGIVSPFAGIVADRVSRKKLVVGSLFVWSLVTYLMGYTSSFDQLYMLRALMGISEALYIPSALSLIADWHEGKSRSLAIGVHMTGLYVGQAIGGFGATVAAAFSWHTTFHWFGILGIAYSVVLLLLLHDKDKDAVNAAPVQQVKPTKGGLFQGLSVVLSDKWVQKNIRGRVYTSAIGLGMTIPALFLLGFGHSLVAIVGAGLLFGIGYGMFDANNMPILCQIISAKYRATAYGIMNMVGVFAGAMVTQVMGKFSDGGNLGLAFAVLGVVVIAALTLQLVCLKPKTDDLE